MAVTWQRNEGINSYWRAGIGPFVRGDRVSYTVHGRSLHDTVTGPTAEFRVGPKLYLALLWHQHQPIYKDTSHPTASGSYIHPWVRLHAIRDYYPMAALVAEHPGVHLTINLTPSLLWQLEDYLEHGATDRTLELTLKTAELRPVGGVMARVTRYNLTLGPFSPQAQVVRFRFTCAHKGCPGQDICCEPKEYQAHIE